MKILTYNLWSGSLLSEILADLNEIWLQDYDILFFQEVTSDAASAHSLRTNSVITTDLYNIIKGIFYGYETVFTEQSFGFGNMTLYKSCFKPTDMSTSIIYLPPDLINWPESPRTALSFKINDVQYIHVHGLWSPHGKIDSPERINQSHKILSMVNSDRCIVLGDLNYHNDMQSLSVLEELFVNQNKQHRVITTRSKHYLKPCKDADYILTRGIVYGQLMVLESTGSDHLPLSFTFHY